MISAILRRFWLWRLKRAGLQIGSGTRIIGRSDFGGEPYLVSIGNDVTISAGVTFITHDGGTWVFRRERKYKDIIKYGRITIHNNCFIGLKTILMPGVEVGPNSVIAAGSIVTSDIPANTVYGGVPARQLMTRNEYIARSVAQCPNYDVDAYKQNTKQEVLRLFPRPW